MQVPSIHILLIEDNPEDARLIRELLAGQTGLAYTLTHVRRMSDAVACVKDGGVDVVILDLSLPDSQDLEALLTIDTHAPAAPILILSNLPDEELAVKAIRAGAQDYLIKGGLSGRGLVRAIRYALERKSLEYELYESHRQYERLVQEVNDGIFILDAQGVFRFANRALVRIQGYDHPDDLTGRHFTEFMPPANAEAMQAAFTRAIEDKDIREMIRVEILRRDGSIGVIEVKPVPILDAEEITGIRGVVRDITDRVRAEEVLSRQADIIDQAHEAIVSTGLDGKVISWNRGAERLFGYAAADMINRPVSVLYPEEEYGFLEQHAIESLEQQGNYAFDTRMRNAAGEDIHTHLSLSLLRDHAGTPDGIILYILDITERRRLEDQLQQAVKMEAIGKLAGGVAHDFNNLLTVINGYAEMMLMALPEDDPLSEQARSIRKSGEKAARLTAQLLAFSRRQVIRPRVIDLNEVIADSVKILRRLIGEDIELITELDPALQRVKMDKGQIDQVIMNLAVNARDAMPEGGTLIIETANATLDDEYAGQHPGARPGPHVLIAVTDTGCGMDKDTQKHIFEPFFTTKPQGQGTGFGLATVYGIVKQNQGNVWVYSEAGQGATFKIYLPVADEPAETVHAPAASLRVSGDAETLLLVEDQDELRKLTVKVLTDHGYTVIEAADGLEALEQCRRHTAPIHLMLTDVVMPKMSGRELARRVTALHPETKVLYMSGYTDHTVVHNGILDADVAFIQKPFTIEALTRKVRESLGAPDRSPPNPSPG